MNTRYEFNMDVPPREAIRLMYVSKSRFGGDWNSVPHTHSCTEVFYCVDGRGQFNVEGKMLDVAPDDMVIVNPRTLHTELSYQANPLEYIVLGIEGIEILFDQKDHGYTMLKCSPQREELLSLMQLLLREIDAREDGCEMVCLSGSCVWRRFRCVSPRRPPRARNVPLQNDISMKITVKALPWTSWRRLPT